MICENCGASVDTTGIRTDDGMEVCCIHCLLNPIGCRCKYGEEKVAEGAEIYGHGTDFKEECERLDRAVNGFAEVMKCKLHEKAARGYCGWDNKSLNRTIRKHLLHGAARLFDGDDGQAVDVANYAMMLFYQRET